MSRTTHAHHETIPIRHTRRAVALGVLAAALAGCAEGSPTVAAPAPEPQAPLAVLTCRADTRTPSLTCAPAGTSGLRADIVTVGGQNQFVRLISTAPSYNSSTHLFTSTVKVQNLLLQPMGTTDGVLPDTAGVRVFFDQVPAAPVTIANATGTGTFVRSGQPYFGYDKTTMGQDGILTPGEVTTAKTWQFNAPAGTNFTFTVYVTASVPSRAASFAALRHVATGTLHSCGLSVAGAAFCWGAGRSKQIGDSTFNYSSVNAAVPVAVRMPAGVQFASLVAHSFHSCGLTAAGQAYCWGSNIWYALGDGTSTDRNYPVRVQQAGHAYTALAAGYAHTCGLAADGQAYCWGGGNTSIGVVGDSSIYVGRPTPVAVRQHGVAYASLGTGDFHTCGLTADGLAYCWGDNGNGQLGDSTRSSLGVPVAVRQGALRFASITGGRYHTCALAADGRAYCWGSNLDGELGDSTAGDVDRLVPRPVAQGSLRFVSLSAGSSHTCGVTAAGQAYCWGYGEVVGRLGIGSATTVWYPIAVHQNGVSFSSVVAGESHSCAVSTAGPIYCWGGNGNSQLGDGTITDRYVPTIVGGTY